ncbi:unnamed protein product [Penicillium salamii]|uniref:Uncharacterized protein n=1 Tax=Penicillium salamii TaxID=1612424 RepID=A0A9W4N5H6_9EURO|nr:unnamed protein product [Penicillium salamii]CAG8232712.1 unnamed protein product [Penicillium salamii]CAG8292051.1 unnamed protein product [Penicillium salamii]
MTALNKMGELVEMVRAPQSRALQTPTPSETSAGPQHTTVVDGVADSCEPDQSFHEFAIDSLSDSDTTVTAQSASATIEGDTSPSPSKAPYTRGHRRRSTHVTRRDLEKFHTEVLGIEHHASWFDEDNGTPRSFTPNDPALEELNRAFANADVSMNTTTNGMASNGNATGPGAYYENASGAVNMANIPSRQTPSPSPSQSSATTQINGGMGAMGAGIPMNAGHQMDLHHLYEMVVELSDVLKNNRDVTKNIVANAEEIVRNGISDSTSSNGQQNGDNPHARIAELERALAREKRLVAHHKHHQEENMKLVHEFENAVGIMVEQIRNYCQNNNMHYLAQKTHYNNLLQAERDAHLESRLDRDYWHAQTMKCAEMIRTAHRLSCEADETPTRVICGLQNEVRAYRFALGMEAEKPEEEYGWEYLKTIPGLE